MSIASSIFHFRGYMRQLPILMTFRFIQSFADRHVKKQLFIILLWWSWSLCYWLHLLVVNTCEKLCVVSFAIECDAGQVPIYIKRIYKSNAYEETIQIWEGEAETGTLMYEKNGLDMAGTEQNYEVCLNKALHTLVLLDA